MIWGPIITISSFIFTLLLDLAFNPDLILKSNNNVLYIVCQLLSVLANGAILTSIVFFLDSARIEWKRTRYLMEVMTSAIQADDGLKFNHPELILTPLFNFMD